MTPGIIGESDLAGTMKSEYVFFNGERVARRDLVAPTGVFYYFSDHLKTASVITDSAGVIKSESDYYPWGGELQFTNADSNHYKFAGKERDSESGLDYFGARYYSNGLGRFITPDWAAKPAAVPYAEYADPQSLNLYTYVRNIPTTKIDIDGHDDEDGVLMKWLKSLIQPAMDAHASRDSSQTVDHSPPMNVLTNTTSQQFVANTTAKVSTATEVMGDLASLVDFTGMGSAIRSAAHNDAAGAFLSVAFIHMPGGGSMSLSEAKGLVGAWSKGTFANRAESIAYHFDKHGAEVGAKGAFQYMRKATSFSKHLKGAKSKDLGDGVTRFTKNGKYIDMNKEKKILSFGKQ